MSSLHGLYTVAGAAACYQKCYGHTWKKQGAGLGAELPVVSRDKAIARI